ncbi:uncharacterized protein SCODWIG_03763 [Saccharomycodes ludwigii]|uniref:Protein ECM3 n=2 Tax=Saccharomycodes ludwigii TaxID=36035 RepID=A0A376BBD5_9ASCO|nr:uncharacterized protein SCODWIG_03763 [Saccharomycodes ludwigii]
MISVETSRGISNLVINAILPCLTFNKIVGNLEDKDIKEIGAICLTAIMLFTAGGLGAYALLYITPVPEKWKWGLIFAGLFPNISDLPIAYMQSMTTTNLFSSDQVDKGVAYTCIFLTVQNFMMMNLGMFRIVGLDFREDIKHNSDEEAYVVSKQGEEESQNISDANGEPISNNNTDKLRSVNTQDMPVGEIFKNNNSTIDNSNQSIYCIPQNTDMYKEPLHIYLTNNSVTTTASAPKSMNEISYTKIKRRKRTQSLVSEYSALSRIRSGDIDLTKPLTLTSEVGNVNYGDNLVDEDCEIGIHAKDNNSLYLSAKDTISTIHNIPGNFDGFCTKYHLKWLHYILINFCRPASIGTILGIICAMIPWVKALFVHTDVHVHQAPDGEPVLNFLMDFTSYIANACVPLGLLLLGGTLGRLEINNIPQGFLKTALSMTLIRLTILPIIGVAWANKLYDMHWVDTVIAKFVVILTWSMPNATAQVYFTAFYTPLEGRHLQMDCLSIFFLLEYMVLFITVSFVISYTLKVDLKF